MPWPKTVRGWLELGVLVGSILVGAATLGWNFHQSNAYAGDVERLEQMVAEGLDNVLQKQQSDLCTQWLSEITMLEAREASGELTPGQRDRLVFLRGQYRAKCEGGNS